MPTRNRTRRTLKIVIAAVAGVALLAFIVVGGFALVVSHTYDANRHVVDAFPAAADRPAAAKGKAADAMNLLLVGTDVDRADPEAPQFVGKRESDTLMLLHIPADRSKVYVISILRNSLVDVPGHGKQPINAAYAYGGVKLTVQAVEGLTGVRVDHVVDVSMSGVQDLTNALGGVFVNNSTAFQNDGHAFPVGRQRLNGAAAVAFLRAGDFRADGDTTRVDSQQRYFKGVLDQVLNAHILLDPLSIATTVSLFSPFLTTDQGFDSSTVARLGLSLRGIHGSDVRMLHVPQSAVGEVNGASVVLLDQARLTALKTALRTDTVGAYAG